MYQEVGLYYYELGKTGCYVPRSRSLLLCTRRDRLLGSRSIQYVLGKTGCCVPRSRSILLCTRNYGLLCTRRDWLLCNRKQKYTTCIRKDRFLCTKKQEYTIVYQERQVAMLQEVDVYYVLLKTGCYVPGGVSIPFCNRRDRLLCTKKFMSILLCTRGDKMLCIIRCEYTNMFQERKVAMYQ